MQYNPEVHDRRSIRMKGYDYAQAGAYFITICCDNRISRFGTIIASQNNKDVEMQLNEFGQVAYSELTKLPQRFPNMELDVFQIMPNHMHGIIILNDHLISMNNVGAIPCGCPIGDNAEIDNTVNWAGASPAINDDQKTITVGDIVGAYKSLVARKCLDLFKLAVETGNVSKYEMMGKIWQRNYHEHIIRNEKSYRVISEYIMNNPVNWGVDTFFNE